MSQLESLPHYSHYVLLLVNIYMWYFRDLKHLIGNIIAGVIELSE